MRTHFKTDRRKPSKCIGCGNDFTPPVFCFYSLCDMCFKIFDRAKMNGRLGHGPECEDVDKWLTDMREGFDEKDKN